MLASSGGAVAALALVTAHPHDVATLVAHEPPIDSVLPDAEAVHRARAAYTQVYQDRGWGAGMEGLARNGGDLTYRRTPSGIRSFAA